MKCPCGNRKIAIYGFEYKKPISCSVCRQPDMVNVVNKRCIVCKKKQPVFGSVADNIALYCIKCSPAGMQDVKNKKCITCQKTRATFGSVDDNIALYCIKCSPDGMRDVKSKKCIVCKKKQPSLGDLSDNIVLYCADCAPANTQNVKSKKCIVCKKKQPTFGDPNDGIRKWCVDCMPKGMIDIKSKRCSYCKLFRCNPKYKEFCSQCYFFKHPNDKRIRNYKTKEQAFTTKLAELYPMAQLDSIISGGCSRRRPDFLLELMTHCIIVEIDENQHRGYESTCEQQRINDMFTDLGDRNVVFIRFNPDNYIQDGIRTKGCFNSKMKLNTKEFTIRLNCAIARIEHSLNHVPTEVIITEEHFFSN